MIKKLMEKKAKRRAKLDKELALELEKIDLIRDRQADVQRDWPLGKKVSRMKIPMMVSLHHSGNQIDFEYVANGKIQIITYYHEQLGEFEKCL